MATGYNTHGNNEALVLYTVWWNIQLKESVIYGIIGVQRTLHVSRWVSSHCLCETTLSIRSNNLSIDLHAKRIPCQPLAVILLFPLLPSIIYNSHRWTDTMDPFVFRDFEYMFVSGVYFSCLNTVSSFSFVSLIDTGWPGVNGSRSTSLQILKWSLSWFSRLTSLSEEGNKNRVPLDSRRLLTL